MRYKHALFLNPYVESSSSTAISLFPPTGLEYVATSARDYVEKVTLLDLRHGEDLANIDKLIDFIQKEIDIVCVSISWDRQLDQVYKILNSIPDRIPLIIGGYTATEKVEEIFKVCPKVDIVVRGEGEETIKEIMEDMPKENIPGISYRKDGKIVHNENRPLPDINIIAPPDRSLRHCKYYAVSNGTRMMSASFDTIMSSRGCPFNCKFCTFSLNPLGQKRSYVSRSPESVVKEIEEISADIILFSDDNFFTEHKRASKICDLIVERGIKKRFVVQARIDIAKQPELLEKAVKAGFKMLLLGIESSHDRILKEFNKGFDQKMIREYFKVLNKFPIFYHGNYIYGNISETEEEMIYLAKFSKEIGVDSVAFSRLRVNKFSPLKKVVEETPGYHLTDKGVLFSDKYSHATLKKIHRKMKFAFYTPLTLLKLVKKMMLSGFITSRDIVSFLGATPALLKGLIAREVQKKRLGDSIKRMFGKHA